MRPISDLTDRALVEAFLLTRDEWVFQLIYRRHGAALWRLALYCADGNRSDAEDVLQEVWMRAVERLPEFRWESGLRTWLSGFVILRSRERRRAVNTQNQRYAPMEAALLAQVPPGFNPEKLDLQAAIQLLPPGFRAVLTLHDVEGYKHEEIARMLGISAGTSKSQLSRARETLRKQILNAEL